MGRVPARVAELPAVAASKRHWAGNDCVLMQTAADWVCSSCKFPNIGALWNCDLCDQRRPRAGAGSSSSSPHPSNSDAATLGCPVAKLQAETEELSGLVCALGDAISRAADEGDGWRTKGERSTAARNPKPTKRAKLPKDPFSKAAERAPKASRPAGGGAPARTPATTGGGAARRRDAPPGSSSALPALDPAAADEDRFDIPSPLEVAHVARVTTRGAEPGAPAPHSRAAAPPLPTPPPPTPPPREPTAAAPQERPLADGALRLQHAKICLTYHSDKSILRHQVIGADGAPTDAGGCTVWGVTGEEWRALSRAPDLAGFDRAREALLLRAKARGKLVAMS